MTAIAVSKRSVKVVCGVSSYGKTLFGIRYALNAPLAVRYFYDAEFSELDPAQPEYAHRLKLPPARTAADLDLALCRGWVCFDPHTMFPGRLDEGLEFFCEWAYETSKRIEGEKALFVDEIWRYTNPHTLPPNLATIVQTGRRARLQLVCNTQEPSGLGKIANGMSELVAFRLQSRANLDWIEFNGLDPAEVGQLNVRQFVARNCDTGGMLRGTIRV